MRKYKIREKRKLVIITREGGWRLSQTCPAHQSLCITHPPCPPHAPPTSLFIYTQWPPHAPPTWATAIAWLEMHFILNNYNNLVLLVLSQEAVKILELAAKRGERGANCLMLHQMIHQLWRNRKVGGLMSSGSVSTVSVQFPSRHTEHSSPSPATRCMYSLIYKEITFSQRLHC